MNCRLFAIALIAVVGLVPALQSEKANASTQRSATATATILTIAVNRDEPPSSRQARVTKYIGPDGHVTRPDDPQARKIIIVDLP